MNEGKILGLFLLLLLLLLLQAPGENFPIQIGGCSFGKGKVIRRRGLDRDDNDDGDGT